MNNQVVLTISSVNHSFNTVSVSGTQSKRVAAESTPMLPESLEVSHQDLKSGRRRSLVRFTVSYNDTTGAVAIPRSATYSLIIDRHVASCAETVSDLGFSLISQLLATETLTDAVLLGEV